jgi:peptidoglycan/LPS O-acetylase OafA/YrhL
MKDEALERGSVTLKFNENLQYVRAIAALSVMLYHAAHYVHIQLGPGLYDGFHHFLGLYGVEIFFALSGYLMMELSQKQSAYRFLVARIVRIYPALLIATIIAIILDPFRIIPKFDWRSITLVPSKFIFYSLNVEWSLVHEMFFYIVISTFIFSSFQRFLPVVGILWIIVIIHYSATPLPRIGRADISQILIMQANAGFAAGLLIPFISRLFARWSAFFLVIFVAAIPVSYFGPAYYARIIAGIGSAFLVAAAVQRTRPVLVGKPATVMKNLGDWSYAMYLIHVPVVLVVLRILPSGLNKLVVYILCVIMAFVFSIGLGVIDLKIHSFLRNKVRHMQDDILKNRMAVFVAGYFFLSLVLLAI